MDIADRLIEIQSKLPDHVDLVAVSKTKPDEQLLEAYEAGQRVFGENKVQELVGKQERLPQDIDWHMIGHLQRNKVKYIAPFVGLIHAVDSERLLKEIDKQALKAERQVPVLLQVHIAKEDTKFGWDPAELRHGFQDLLSSYPNVRFDGLMGMATHTTVDAQVHHEFSGLKALKDELQVHALDAGHPWHTLSMGMTGDYKIAIECGSTMVRIGSAIFGARN